MRTRLIVLPLMLFAAGVVRGQSPDAKGIEFFETKIRPVLVDQCYQCHSAEAEKNKKLKGGLRLDTKAALLKGGESGPALVPGKSKTGHLIEALRYEGDVKMPPKKKLSAEVIADFAKWIDMGAPDPRDGDAPVAAAKKIDVEAGRKFWAFQPIKKSERAQYDHDWAKTEIDFYILDKLRPNITPNASASREKLIRRAYFDVWGLPPTPAQIDEFVNDPDPRAYEKLVDHLLAGQAYGERWGRHWLDVVRFAESGGYEFDGDRPGAFHYRDWVIKALNADMPYDEFVRLQIAGDVLKPGDFNAATATGFLVAGPYPGQTTSKTLALIRYNHLDDMASTIGSSMLGLTLGCARCHDHKYDPLPQADYYRLIANLARTDSNKTNMDMQPEVYLKAKAKFDAEHAPFVAAKEKFETEKLPGRVAAWYAKAASAPVAPWQVLDPIEFKGKGPMERLVDGSVRPKGKIDKSDTITIVAQTNLKNITGLRLEALADADFPKKGPGLDPDGGFSVAEMTVQAAPIGGKAKAVKLKAVTATSETKEQPLTAAIDGNPKTEWRIDPEAAGKDHAAQFEIVGPLGDAAGLQLTLTMKFGGKTSSIGRPRISVTTQSTAPELTAASDLQNVHEIVALLKPSEGKLTPANLPAVARWYRQFDEEYAGLLKKVEDHAKTAPDHKKVQVPVFVAAGNRGGDVHFLIRGEVERKGAKAEPGYLQVLWRSEEKPAAKVDPRVALADWIVNVETGAGPLAARVMVNRLWQHHFGRGIVATPNDFGAQGEAPTHPELLDYLAQELINGGWKLKPLHRQIMLSAVYMQGGELNPAAQKADPNNRLWWRRPPLRLEAEIVRDNLLAVGGSLDPKMYGAGTLDVNSPRRSIYLTVKRSQPVQMMQMLDAPETIQSIGERSLTTVPTQSLAFMNSPLVRKQAENLAKMLLKSDNDGVIERAYLATLGRRPTPGERQRMTAFIESQANSYGTNGREQALADFCQALLCSNEFVYVD